MRFRLRTLLIAAAVLPPILAPLGVWGWREYLAWRNTQLRPGQVEPGYLGVKINDMPVAGVGVRVNMVRPGTPAEAGGLKAGDIITAMNSRPTRNWMEFDTEMDRTTAGIRLPIVVIRDGKKKSLVVTLARTPRR